MNNTIPYKKIILVSCIISILAGVLLHFAYDFSGKNVIVGIFTPVNESVWEHLKLLYIPFALFGIAFYFYSKKRLSNIFLLTLFGNVVGMFTITTLYYLGLEIFKTDNMVFNIIAYVLGVILAFVVFYLGIYNKDFIEETKDSSLIGICGLILLFTIFILNTFIPIKFDMTKDPVTKTYGIHKTV